MKLAVTSSLLGVLVLTSLHSRNAFTGAWWILSGYLFVGVLGGVLVGWQLRDGRELTWKEWLLFIGALYLADLVRYAFISFRGGLPANADQWRGVLLAFPLLLVLALASGSLAFGFAWSLKRYGLNG